MTSRNNTEFEDICPRLGSFAYSGSHGTLVESGWGLKFVEITNDEMRRIHSAEEIS
jgi:hypothetical protein